MYFYFPYTPKLAFQQPPPLSSTMIKSNATGGNDCLKIVVPDSINKVVLYKGTCETVVILNN